MQSHLIIRLLALTLFGFATVSNAAALRITPVTLDVTAPAKAGAISVTNIADDDVTLQIRAFKWIQHDGKDELVETQDVLASPPIAQVKAGGTYTLRVLRTAQRPLSGEESYRLILDELPKPVDPTAAGQSVRMVLRSSLPIFFVQPGSKPDLAFKAWAEPGKLRVRITNSGQRHVKLAGLRLTIGKEELSLAGGSNGYILPGSEILYETTAASAKLLSDLSSENRAGRLTAQLISGPGSSIELRQAVTFEEQ